LVQAEPAPSTVAVPVEPERKPIAPSPLLSVPPVWIVSVPVAEIADIENAGIDGAAILDAQRAGADIADKEIGGVCPGRAGASDRRGAGQPRIVADSAAGAAQRAAVLDRQRAVADIADIEIEGLRAGRSDHRRRDRVDQCGVRAGRNSTGRPVGGGEPVGRGGAGPKSLAEREGVDVARTSPSATMDVVPSRRRDNALAFSAARRQFGCLRATTARTGSSSAASDATK